MAPNLARFLGRLHRRLILLRLLECAAIGAAAAAALAVVLLPILILRGKAAFPVVAVMLPLGALVGAVWLLLRRPRVLDAAGEADRQLALADLLATAWTIARDRAAIDDPFERAVLLTADARAASLAPSAVVINRLGVRGWTGVGVAWALAMTLALLSANPIASQASGGDTAPGKQGVGRASERAQERGDVASGSRSTPIVPDHPDRADENGFNPARRTMRVAGEAADASDAARSADPGGAGGGAGRSASSTGERLANATGAATTGGRTGSIPGGGGGASANADGSGNGTSTLSSGETANGGAPPPWTAPGWSAARSAATHAVRSGAVPSQYHDLIRAYFDREAGERQAGRAAR